MAGRAAPCGTMPDLDVFRSATLRVVSTVGDRARLDASGFELVTFEPLAGPEGASPARFGAGFARKHGLNALHVVPSGSDWYQYPDIDACLGAVARLVGPGAVAFGSSMGGYAAIMLADRLGAAKSIALSPQFSIQRALVPFEPRWTSEAARIRFMAWDGQPARHCHHYVLYDPSGRDAEHVRLIAAHAPRVTALDVPHGGHPVGQVLVQAKLLSGLVLDLLRGNPDPDGLRAAIAEGVLRSPQYFLNRSAATRDPQERADFLQAGLALDPDCPWLRGSLGILLLHQRRPAEALPHLVHALRRRPLRRQFREAYRDACAAAGVAPDAALLAAPGAEPG